MFLDDKQSVIRHIINKMEDCLQIQTCSKNGMSLWSMLQISINVTFFFMYEQCYPTP